MIFVKKSDTIVEVFLFSHVYDTFVGFLTGVAWCRGFMPTECSKCKKVVQGFLDDEATPLLHT